MFLFDYSAFKALWISVMGTKKTLQQEIFFHCFSIACNSQCQN